MSKPYQMSQSYVMSDDAVRFATMIMAGQGSAMKMLPSLPNVLLRLIFAGCKRMGFQGCRFMLSGFSAGW